MKESEIKIPANGVELVGNLNIPARCNALVVFSHGSGSSRFSTRNRHVASILNDSNMATLLTDLLSEKEDSVYENRFNIGLITDRLSAVVRHCTTIAELKHLPFGCFGASTGAASALRTAARLPKLVNAVVSRGGRPDLAGADLGFVKAPTLLIIGSLDTDVIKLNEEAYSQMSCKKEMKIVQGATHLFEEPGKLDEVARLAVAWFDKNLIRNPKPAETK
jgi:putative phosphoribosyl transferase